MSMDFYNKFFSDLPPDAIETDAASPEPLDVEASEKTKCRAKKVFSRVFLALAVYQTITFVLINALAFVTAYAFPKIYGYLFGGESGQLLVNAVVQYAIALPVAFLILRRVERKAPARGKVGFGEFVVLFLVTQVLTVIGNIISSVVDVAIVTDLGISGGSEIEAAPLWVYFIFVVILAPVFEEILMRKLVIDRLSRYGTGFAVVVSAAAFGIFHGNFTQMFYAALGGLVLGYLYVKGGLKLSIAMHMLFNFWGTIVAMLVYMSYDAIASSAENVLVTVLAVLLIINYAVLSILILVFGIINFIKKIKQVKREFHPFDGADERLQKGTVARTLIGNGGAIYFLAISGVIIFSSIIFTVIYMILGV